MVGALLAFGPASVMAWYMHRPLHTRIALVVATFVLVGELLLRRFAPRSAFYKRWTGFFQAIGAVWTAVILSIVYFVSVGPISLIQRMGGKDLLDRKMDDGKPSAWHAHEPNPLGERAGARHQF